MAYRTQKEKQLADSLTQETQRQATAQTMAEEELFSFAEYDPGKAEKTGYSDYSYWKSTFAVFLRNKTAVFLLCLMAALLLFTFIQPYLPGQRPATLINNDPVTGMQMANRPPDSEFWFGTNSIGQDLWSMVWSGTRTSLFIGFAVACVEAVAGILVGTLWGYVRKLDRLFTEIYNLFDSVPYIIYMTLIALMVGQSFTIMATAMIFLGWFQMARRVRNMVIMYRDREYNLASRCLGTPLWRVLTKNILPYLVSVIILQMALRIPATINLESTLSYLGLGLGIDTPSLGLILSKVRTFFLDYPYLLVFPASIVSIISISFYIMGNAFSDASDPRNHV